MAATIRARGLVKRYGAVTALDGLSLTVPEGTVLGLLGPTGAGKTTAVRSLPMSRSAVLVGRATSDVLNDVLVLTVMSLTGPVVGWRVRTSVLEALGAFLLLLVFAYAVSWIMAWVGLLVPSVEVVRSASSLVILPLTVPANTSVPSEGLPTPLRVLAEWNHVSSVTQAARQLFGLPPDAVGPGTWAWQAVFVPLSVRQYARAATR